MDTLNDLYIEAINSLQKIMNYQDTSSTQKLSVLLNLQHNIDDMCDIISHQTYTDRKKFSKKVLIE